MIVMVFITSSSLHSQCVQTAPWLEDFSNGIPSCWTQTSTAGGSWLTPGYMLGDMNPTYDHTTGVSNEDFIYFYPNYQASNVILESPEINVANLTTPTLRFWLRSYFPNSSIPLPNTISVEFFDGTAYVPVDLLSGDYGYEFKPFVYDLSAYVYNTNLVRFRFLANKGASPLAPQRNQIALDDIEVLDVDTYCLEPLELQFTGSTASTADFSWTEFTGTAGDYIVEYSSFHDISDVLGSVVVNGATTGTLSSIPSNQFFKARVRRICAPGDTSDYSNVVVFHTYDVGDYLDYDFQASPLGYVDIVQPVNEIYVNNNLNNNHTLTWPLFVQGIAYDEISISENGAIFFGHETSGIGVNNTALTTSNDVGVYPFWDKLNNGSFYLKEVGSAPNRVLIVTYNDRDYTPSIPGESIDFQVQFFEATQEIYVVYDDVEFGGAASFADFGAEATMGWVGPNSIQEVSFNDDQVLMHHNTIRYFYTDCPNVENITVTQNLDDQIALSWSNGLSSSTSFTVEWGLEGFLPGNGMGTMSVNTNAATITGLTQLTDYQFYVYADCGTTASTGRDIHVQSAPICATPFGLSTGMMVDTLVANWNWISTNASAVIDSYNVSLTMNGQSPYAGTITNVDGNLTDTIVDPNILNGTVYDVYVQAQCTSGDTSLFFGPIVTLSPLLNDTICYAEHIQVDDQVNVFTNIGATTGPMDIYFIPQPGSATGSWIQPQPSKSTWFTFEAPASGNVRISGADYGYAGKTAVYEISDCSDTSTYNLIGANDLDALNEGTGSVTNWVMCGLTPGNTYYLGHFSNTQYTSPGYYSLRLTEVDFSAGDVLGAIQVCQGDTLDLYGTINGNDMINSTWTDLSGTNQLYTNAFATSLVSNGTYQFEHKVEYGCYVDTTVVDVELFEQAFAGINGSIEVCKNNPLILTDALSGDINIDGTWFDPQDNEITGLPVAPSFPGQFNYDYVVGNGVCPNDTATVVVVVNPTCDYLSMDGFENGALEVYPNPASDVLNIVSNTEHEDMEILLMDLNGRVVLKSSSVLMAGNAVKLDLSSVTEGMYMLTVANANKTATFKVVVK
ncbi:Por secretion system C-terminal sorting domain-containing protein [Lishizhenia tianjinensis]|uniref:Por secretion system C-terminal sorting domain-containing protein n=2 Tax=Lishizhenia tianjinensis TaxID=477690 RepID=A0A1I7AWE5_9FLAO|nr:Por secretion system C-terminal sorting domain-containing protein [Lishizhenia tianjinensis]